MRWLHDTRGRTISSQGVTPDLIGQDEQVGRRETGLPLIRGLRFYVAASLLIAALTAVATIAGLLSPDTVYSSVEQRHSFVVNDVVTMVIGLPALFLCLWLAWRGSLAGLLFWPGALLYGLYNYTAYLFGMLFEGLFLLYLAIVVLSLYTLIGLVAGINGRTVKAHLRGRVPERLGGSMLLIMGAMFMLLAVGTLLGDQIGRTALSPAELSVFVADVFVSVAWIIGGIELLRRRPFGYVAGTGLLFSACLLFIGVIGIVILQARLSRTAFPLQDVIVLLLMSLLAIIPTALFLRGILRSSWDDLQRQDSLQELTDRS